MDQFEAHLRAKLDSPAQALEFIIRELNSPHGRADLIVAKINWARLPALLQDQSKASLLTSPANARILATLTYRTPRSCTYLTTITGLAERTLRRHIHQLKSAGLVTIHNDMATSLAHRLPWNMVDIIAYEGKLTNWRRALHQALSYRSYSRCVQIVMPRSGAQHAKALSPLFRAQGIGLISIGQDGFTRTEIRSRKHRRPASRRLYLMAVGNVLTRLPYEAIDLHASFGSKPIQRI